jgi:hypothetical protein
MLRSQSASQRKHSAQQKSDLNDSQKRHCANRNIEKTRIQHFVESKSIPNSILQNNGHESLDLNKEIEVESIDRRAKRGTLAFRFVISSSAHEPQHCSGLVIRQTKSSLTLYFVRYLVRSASAIFGDLSTPRQQAVEIIAIMTAVELAMDL